jgi:hypothetical protein
MRVMESQQMNPKETISHIKELCEDARDKPQFLTFYQIAEWCHNQMQSLTQCQSNTNPAMRARR